jgi:glyoxylate reductase
VTPPRILASSSFGFLDDADSAALGEVTIHPIGRWSRELAAGVDALAVAASDLVPTELLHAATSCRVLAVFGTGTDGIDLEAATTAGIAVANTPGIATGSVADLTFGLLLSLSRQLGRARRMAEQGEVVPPEEELGFDLNGRTLGLVGFGDIGAAVAKRAEAFEMRVVYCRSRPPEAGGGDGRHRSFEQVLAEADVLSLHAPATESTRHIIDAAALARMRPGAVLINTARSALVDERALLAALDSGQLGGAGLDVYDGEPQPPTQLLRHPNVVLTAHVGGATLETRNRMRERLRQILREATSGSLPATTVNGQVKWRTAQPAETPRP